MRLGLAPFVTLVGLGLACTAVKSAQITNAPNPRLFTEKVAGVEGAPLTYYVLIVDAWRFRFVPPLNWSVKFDPLAKAVAVLAPNLEVGIHLRMSFNDGEPQQAGDAREYLDEILDRYETVKNVRSYNRPVAGINCLGFEFERSVGADISTAVRLIRVPFTGGVIEFEMDSSTEKASEYNQAFAALLGSFQIQPAGAR